MCVGGALAASGHASAAEPQWLMRPAVFVHVIGACFWIGSLLPLGMLLLRRGHEAEDALRRFSDIIPFALFPLVVAGFVLAYVQLGTPGDAWLTPYAAVLAGKLVLVLALFLLDAWNRWRLTGGVLSGDGIVRRRMALSVRAEIVLVLLILGLVAGWRLTVPPRAIAQELAVPAQTQMMSGNLMAELNVLPGRVGETSISVSLMTMDMAPVKPLSVKIKLEQKAAAVGPIEMGAQLGTDGNWHADHVVLPISGAWSVNVEARTGMFDLAEFDGTVEIQ